MSPSRLRRTGAWLGACAALALSASALTPAAAGAAPAAPELAFDSTALVVGGPAKLQPLYLWNHSQAFTLHDVRVTIDTAKLAGVATTRFPFDLPDGCTTAGALTTCAFETLNGKDGLAGLTTISFAAATGARVGDEGTATVKVTSRELAPLARTARITVAEGVQLEVDDSVSSASGAPGATVATPLGLRNGGENAITGVEMFFFIDPWYTPAKRYSNCWYGTSAGYCRFDTTLTAGTSYAVSERVGVKLRADIPAPSVVGPTYYWKTPTDNRDNVDLVKSQRPKRGTAGELRLVAKPGARAAAGAQTDTTGGVDWQSVIIDVRGDQGADVAAVGARLSAKVGTAVVAKVGAKNLGPAFVFGFPEPAAKVTVTAPKGTTVLSAPDGCVVAKDDKRTYVCTTAVSPFDVGKSVTWPFKLRVDTAGELTGTVTAKADGKELTAANNTAKLVVNPAGGAGAGDSGADTGGSLAITGAPVMLLSVAGLVLLGGGAAAYVVARRRRARFVA